MPTTTADNDNRPAEFDERVMQYIPGLRRLATKRVPYPYREDLVTDTIIHALENWRSFRENGGMWNWLAWSMRGIVSNQASYAARRSESLSFAPIEHGMRVSVEANQDDVVELAEVLRKIPAGRDGSILLRRAMGEGLKEIAEDFGISRQRVQQLEERARAELRAAA